MTVYIKGVTLAEISGPGRPANYFVRPGPARNLYIQNLYNGLDIFLRGGDKNLWKFVKYG